MLKEYVNNPAKIATDLRDMVDSGDVNPLMIKIMYDIFSNAMKDASINGAIMDEADKHEGEFSYNGFRFKKMNRKNYVFKHDAEWQRIAGMKKAREEQMKAAIQHEVVDSNTGELIPSAEVNTSTCLKRL